MKQNHERSYPSIQHFNMRRKEGKNTINFIILDRTTITFQYNKEY